jgi:hypothetical protein
VTIEQHIEQARQEGRRAGLRDGKYIILCAVLCSRFGDGLDMDIDPRIAAASLEQLDRWTGRMHSVASIAELLDDAARESP